MLLIFSHVCLNPRKITTRLQVAVTVEVSTSQSINDPLGLLVTAEQLVGVGHECVLICEVALHFQLLSPIDASLQVVTLDLS
jgi:hypothetical protein